MDKTTTIEWLMIERSWFFQESTPICTCAENQRRRQMRSNTHLYSIWYRVIENATFDIPYLCCKKGRKKKEKRLKCLINWCLDKSRIGMVEDDADDRSIMPQRRLEKPTIERWSCHSILQNVPHQRVSLCHSSRQDEITHSDVLLLSLKICQCSVCDIQFRKKYTQSTILWLVHIQSNTVYGDIWSENIENMTNLKEISLTLKNWKMY